MLTSIAVAPSVLVLDALEATAPLQATARDQNGATISVQLTWTSSDTAVATVNADGLLTAINNGSVTVTARSGAVSGSASVTVEQAPASVALSEDEVLLTALGAEQQLEASVRDSNDNAMSAELNWASSDPAVVAVDGDGRITAQANGSATVTVGTGSISDSVTVTVEQTVSRVELAPNAVTLTAINQRAQLAARALDANGHPVTADISLVSSDSMVASVDVDGLVTALRNGSTTITATAGRDAASATATVIVRQVLAGITVMPHDVTLTAIGESAQVQVVAQDANGFPMAVDISLSSSDPAVASVNAEGLVTAQSNGTTTITANAGPVAGAVTVTVRQALARITISPDIVRLAAIGESTQLQVTAQDANGFPMAVDTSLSSSDPAVASVNAEGLVTAEANGTATITATAGPVAGTVTVTVRQALARITISPDIVRLAAIGESAQLQITGQDANGHPMDIDASLSSSDPAVASVNATGLVTAEADGTATVTARTGSISGTATITVEQTVFRVALVPETVTLTAIDQRAQIAATALDANGHSVASDIGFASSDSMVATVDGTGLVTALRNGTTTITATAGPVAGTVTVAVRQALARITVVPEVVTLAAIGESAQLQITGQDANGHPMDIDASLSSSDPAVASVNATGLVTAEADGTATVTARTGSISGTATITVEQTVFRVALVPETVTLTAIDQRAQIAATALDANGHSVASDIGFASSDSMVATVDGTGLVTALRNGTTTITATAGPVAGTVTVAVRQALARITVVPEVVTLAAIGESAQLQITGQDANGHPMDIDASLSSSDPAVASVNATGLVTAQSNGTATISAMVRDQGRDVSASVAIIVEEQIFPLDPLTFTGDPNVRDLRTGRAPLHNAAMANAPKLIAGLLQAGAYVDERDVYGFTPLHLAAFANAATAIELLVEAGADLEARSRFLSTPLQFSMFHSGADTRAAIAALLEAGADPNPHIGGSSSLVSRATTTAVYARASALHRAMATLNMLLEAGADPNGSDEGGQTPLHWAVQGDQLNVVTTLLESGANPNARDIMGRSPMWYWAGLGTSPEILKPMLQAGGDRETRNNAGIPLLHHAAARDRPVTLTALVQAGANLHIRDRRSDGTALHAAAGSNEFGQLTVSAAAGFAALLEAGADPDTRDSSNVTPLERTHSSSMNMVKTLLDAHAGRTTVNSHARDALGHTALHAAARANSPRLIAALVSAGADVDALDNEGNTPVLLAAGARLRLGRNVPPRTYAPAAISALAAAGADLDVASPFERRTALQHAAYFDKPDVIMALLEGGADLEERGNNDYSPLQVAMRRGNTASIVVLAEAEVGLRSTPFIDFARVAALAAGNPAALPRARVIVDARDSESRTVLHWVVGWHNAIAVDAFEALIEAGADPNARDNLTETPLFRALLAGNRKMIAALAKAGANLNLRSSGETALQRAIRWNRPKTVSALAAAGADLELRDSNGWTALHLAANEGRPAMIAALVEAGADINARDFSDRTALHLAANRDIPGRWDGGPSTPAAVAALVEAGADLGARDIGGNTALHAATEAGNQAASGILQAIGARFTSGPDTDVSGLNYRLVALDLFQGPMVWQWRAEGTAAGAGIGGTEEVGTAHGKILLGRAMTVAARVGMEVPEPVPQLQLSLRDASGRTWTSDAVPVSSARLVAVDSQSESGLWESEYVYELPADWVESGLRANFSIDFLNRIEETNENDNTATLTIDGHAVPDFDVTLVPIVFSGDTPAVNTDLYMAVIGDLLPIGGYRAQVGRVLDLSNRNLGLGNTDLSRDTALRELLQRWNAEAGENEYYHGVMSSGEVGIGGFGGAALVNGKVAVSHFIHEDCRIDINFCGAGVQAHEIGHNFGLVHLPGRCSGPGPVDQAFPYDDAGIGPRRGWVASRDRFVNPGDEDQHYDVMGYCEPRFVSDYNYNKMVEYRLSGTVQPPSGSGRAGPTLEIGSEASLLSFMPPPSVAYATPPGPASVFGSTDLVLEVADIVEDTGPSLAFTGAVDEYGLWSTIGIDASTQPPRSANAVGEYFFTLQDAFQREIYREPMALLTTAHGEMSRSWAVRVPVPDHTPAFLAILDASGVPLHIEPIVVPPVTLIESNP